MLGGMFGSADDLFGGMFGGGAGGAEAEAAEGEQEKEKPWFTSFKFDGLLSIFADTEPQKSPRSLPGCSRVVGLLQGCCELTVVD